MADDRFKHAESEYFRLKGLLSTGRITKEQFEQALRQLIVQDPQGRQWILGVDDGRWYVFDGRSWVQAEPTVTSAPAVPFVPMPAAIPMPPSRESSVLRVLVVIGAFLLICLCGIVGVLVASEMGIVQFNFGPTRAPTPSFIQPPGAVIFATPFIPPIATNPPTETPTHTPTPTPTLTPTVTLTPTPTTTPTVTPRPTGYCADPNARFENVVDGQTIEPLQAFLGTATADNFAGYLVEWIRPGLVLYRSTTPVVHGQIFVWNTYTVGNGIYPVALTVFLTDGTTLAPCVINVIVAH